jgi:hypothetical protein
LKDALGKDATATQALKDALICLKYAFVDPALPAQAKVDPYLCDIVITDEYNSLLARHKPPLNAPEYAGVDCFTGLSTELVTRGLSEVSKMSEQLANPALKAALLHALGLPDGLLVRQWQGALEWLAVGVSAEHINVVQRAGFPSPSSLVSEPQTRLADTVVTLWRAAGYSGPAPTNDELERMGAAL